MLPLSQETSAFSYFEMQIQFVTTCPMNAYTQKKYPTEFPLNPCLKPFNVFPLFMAQNVKPLMRPHDLTYLPAHLSPHALVLCAPATLFFPEFFSGRVPAHLGENMQSPYLSYLCLGQLMLPIKSPFKYHSHSTLNLLEVEEQD